MYVTQIHIIYKDVHKYYTYVHLIIHIIRMCVLNFYDEIRF